MDDANVAQAAGPGFVNPLQYQSATDPYLTMVRPDPSLAPAYGLQGLRSGSAGGMVESPSAVLQRMLQYDPNAHLESYSDFGDSGGGIQQQVVFDQSKLPKPQMPGLVQVLNNTPLFNPNATFNDPNYGRMTVDANINRRANDSTWLDTVGPLVVGGAIGLGGGFGMLGNLLSKLPNVASLASNMMQGSGASGITPQQLMLYRLLSMKRG